MTMTRNDRMFVNGKCPVCGKRIMVTSLGYKCENPNCNFFIKGVICDRRIRTSEIEDFLNNRNVPIDGFYRRDCEMSFPSYLRFSKEKGAFLDSFVGKCPVCGGDIRIGKKAFNCSNFSDSANPCSFHIYRCISGHEMTFSEVLQILQQGATSESILFLDDKGKPFYRIIEFDHTKKTTIFKNHAKV